MTRFRSPFPALLLSLALAGVSRPSPAAPAGAAAPAPDSFLAQVSARFEGWDRDQDGVLSANEIELAVHDPSVKGEAAAAAASLRRAIRADSSLKPFTREQLAQYVALAAQKDRNAGEKAPALEAMYAAAREKLAAARRELFPETPRLDMLAQGRLGDCFLLASLGAVVHSDPERLRKIMRPAPDGPAGMVTVSFGDGKELVLPAPTDGELVIGASTRNNGTWANMYEKAVGQRYLEKQTGSRHVTPYSIIGVGGTPNVPLSYLTGHRVVRLGCEGFLDPKLTAVDREAKLNLLRDQLEAVKKAGRLMVGGTASINGPQVKVPGLYYNHSYAVLNYDRATDRVTFWNPMGNRFTPKGPAGLTHGYPTSYGRFDVPLTEAVMWFGSFSVETDQPVEK